MKRMISNGEKMLKRETLFLSKRWLHLIATVLLLLSPCFAAAEEGDAPPLLTLEEAHRMAALHNPSMQNIGESIYQAEVMIWRAWAMVLPNVSATGSIIRNKDEQKMAMPDYSALDMTAMMQGTQTLDDLPTSDMVIQEKWNKSYGFNANMALFNARSIPLIKKAYRYRKYERKSGKHNKNELLFAVSASYYQVRSTAEVIEVSKLALENAEEFLRMSRARKQVGQATKIDVLRAESEVMAAKKELENAKDAYRLAKTGLGYLVGVKGDFRVASPKAKRIEAGGLTTLVDRAKDERADYQAAKLMIEMAKLDYAESWTKWIPTFNISYDWSYNSSAGFAGDNYNWMLIFGMKWSILEGGGRIAELHERKSKIRQARFRHKQLALDIEKEVEENLLEIEKRKRNMRLAAKQVALAEETKTLVDKQYRLGLATSLDVLDAQTALSQTRMNRILEGLQYELAVLSLNKSVGDYHELSGRSNKK